MKHGELEKMRGRNTEELQEEVVKARERLRSLRFDLSRGKVKNSADAREVRREIAQLKTLLNEKKNAPQKETAEKE